jgi:hypothetical protein
MLLSYFMNEYEIFPVARIITGITFIVIIIVIITKYPCMNWSHHVTASWKNLNQIQWYTLVFRKIYATPRGGVCGSTS